MTGHMERFTHFGSGEVLKVCGGGDAFDHEVHVLEGRGHAFDQCLRATFGSRGSRPSPWVGRRSRGEMAAGARNQGPRGTTVPPCISASVQCTELCAHWTGDASSGVVCRACARLSARSRLMRPRTGGK